MSSMSELGDGTFTRWEKQFKGKRWEKQFKISFWFLARK